MNIEKIIADLKGISVFGNDSDLVSHIEGNYQYPKEGIRDAIYSSNISREWSSDDDCSGQGAGDWYECEKTSTQYFFVEKKTREYERVFLNRDNSEIVDNVKRSLESEGHRIKYIIARYNVDGPNWGWFRDTVYVIGGNENG